GFAPAYRGAGSSAPGRARLPGAVPEHHAGALRRSPGDRGGRPTGGPRGDGTEFGAAAAGGERDPERYGGASRPRARRDPGTAGRGIAPPRGGGRRAGYVGGPDRGGRERHRSGPHPRAAAAAIWGGLWTRDAGESRGRRSRRAHGATHDPAPVPRRWCDAMTEIRTLIVDDEALARERVRTLLAGAEGVAVVGELSGGREADVGLGVGSQGTGFYLITAEIDWIEADGKYARLHVGRETPVVRHALKRLADRLKAHGFVRVHRSGIVNADRIKELQPWFHGEYVVI